MEKRKEAERRRRFRQIRRENERRRKEKQRLKHEREERELKARARKLAQHRERLRSQNMLSKKRWINKKKKTRAAPNFEVVTPPPPSSESGLRSVRQESTSVIPSAKVNKVVGKKPVQGFRGSVSLFESLDRVAVEIVQKTRGQVQPTRQSQYFPGESIFYKDGLNHQDESKKTSSTLSNVDIRRSIKELFTDKSAKDPAFLHQSNPPIPPAPSPMSPHVERDHKYHQVKRQGPTVTVQRKVPPIEAAETDPVSPGSVLNQKRLESRLKSIYRGSPRQPNTHPISPPTNDSIDFARAFGIPLAADVDHTQTPDPYSARSERERPFVSMKPPKAMAPSPDVSADRRLSSPRIRVSSNKVQMGRPSTPRRRCVIVGCGRLRCSARGYCQEHLSRILSSERPNALSSRLRRGRQPKKPGDDSRPTCQPRVRFMFNNSPTGRMSEGRNGEMESAEKRSASGGRFEGVSSIRGAVSERLRKETTEDIEKRFPHHSTSRSPRRPKKREKKEKRRFRAAYPNGSLSSRQARETYGGQPSSRRNRIERDQPSINALGLSVEAERLQKSILKLEERLVQLAIRQKEREATKEQGIKGEYAPTYPSSLSNFPRIFPRSCGVDSAIASYIASPRGISRGQNSSKQHGATRKPRLSRGAIQSPAIRIRDRTPPALGYLSRRIRKGKGMR
ncbi:hypothetical protein AAMO2058_001297700 [Amorphochlora amoebiformis]